MLNALNLGFLRLLAVLFFLAGLKNARAEEITVSYAALTAAYMDHIVAIERGYFSEDGLAVKIIRAGGGTATQTLLSGQRNFSSSAGSAPSGVLRGELVKIIYTNLCRRAKKIFSNKQKLIRCRIWSGKKLPSILSAIAAISRPFCF